MNAHTVWYINGRKEAALNNWPKPFGASGEYLERKQVMIENSKYDFTSDTVILTD